MKSKKFKVNSTEFLDNLKNTLNSDTCISSEPVDLDIEMSFFDNLSESELLGKALSRHEENLKKEVNLYHSKINSRLEHLRDMYNNDIFD